MHMARLVARYSGRIYPRLPFLNGFCLMIRRADLDQVGLFDEAAFGQGYGQENDYCLRSAKAGYSLLLIIPTCSTGTLGRRCFDPLPIASTESGCWENGREIYACTIPPTSGKTPG